MLYYNQRHQGGIQLGSRPALPAAQDSLDQEDEEKVIRQRNKERAAFEKPEAKRKSADTVSRMFELEAALSTAQEGAAAGLARKRDEVAPSLRRFSLLG